jgi:hypothetical protein
MVDGDLLASYALSDPGENFSASVLTLNTGQGPSRGAHPPCTPPTIAAVKSKILVTLENVRHS